MAATATLNAQTSEHVGILEPVATTVAAPQFKKAVSFNHILKTGEIHVSEHSIDKLRISLNNNDAATQAYRTVREASEKSLQNNAAVQDLLKKPKWNKADRQNWQKHLAQTINIEVDKVPGFDEYRTMVDIKGSKKATERSTWFNHLSRDIKACKNSNGNEIKTRITEFDCKFNSILEGCLGQEIANKLLADFSEDSNKNSQDYYYIVGNSYSSSNPSHIGYHAFILSPTGDPIEATIDPSETNISAFLVSTNAQFNVEKFMAGQPVTVKASKSTWIYGRHLNLNIVKAITAEEQQSKPTTLVHN